MHPRVQEIFEQVCDLSAEEREQQLAILQATDGALLSDVRSLLDAHDHCGEFLAEATIDRPFDGPETVQIAEKLGDSIGRYKLLEKIGEGGCGLVYMAQQIEPVRRRVALKLIKVGMDTGLMVTRFEAERQALAMMDHPNIASVLDGGATASGRLYFVMDLVRGEPITVYCDRCKMPVPERLRVFQQVCRAIEHAHQKGIVHRDIKPSNVLVTIADGRPLVKVIDFGIAKALNVELTAKTLYTEFRQIIGTPQYMSPEQAERSGVEIDTRSDIYSLGVLLYEILTGATPVDPKRLQSAAWGQWQLLIAQEEPSRPSAKYSSAIETQADIAKHRSVEPAELTNSLRGDLDWIVLKSLEKDRSRRFATASQFAEDIERYLNDQPVLATPPSRRYLLQKFLKRHRRSVVLSSLLIASVLVGLVATAYTAVWALREREIAIDARRAADQRTLQVRRLAALAGSPLLPKAEADQLATDWAKDIEEMRPAVPASDPDLVRLECQYNTWLAHHAVRYNDRKSSEKAGIATRTLLPRAKQVLGLGDANLLSLLNASIQLSGSVKRTPTETARLYDDLIPAIKAIQGSDKSRELLPEYARLLVRANRSDDAERVIDDYLRAIDGNTPTTEEAVRLNVAVNELANWGNSHQRAFDRLRSFRDAGRVASPAASLLGSTDPELAADLKQMQGKWTTNSGPMTLNMTIKDDQGDVEFSGREGNVERDNARFVLSRSGAAKLLTRYRIGEDPSRGDALIYTLSASGDTMIMVQGMLTGVQNQSAPKMREWKRKRE